MEKIKIHVPSARVYYLIKKIDNNYNKRDLLTLFNLVNNNICLNPYYDMILNYQNGIKIFNKLLIILINNVDQDIRYYQDNKRYDLSELLDFKNLLLKLSTRFN